jgi:histidyl-tRNA synthetase
MADKLSAVKGMNDILPASVPRTEKLPDSALWQWFEGAVRTVMARYGYQYLLTPIVEPTALFVRGLGEVTDIVEKEMYSFVDSMNGDKLTLRPEATAGIVRAVIEHNALYNGPLRVWTVGPMFRHERPQKGRYRQFHQLDVEAMGYAGPDVDAEMILMARALWRELGLVEGSHVRLEINSLGQPDERRAHREALIAHFERNASQLDADAQRRLHTNPLRILDSKNPAMQALIEGAPRLMDFLGADSKAHFDAVRATLDAVGLEYRVNTRLVRGMDYYNLTVFEWVTDQLGSQGTVCGGGRYDGLIGQLGGKPAPAPDPGTGPAGARHLRRRVRRRARRRAAAQGAGHARGAARRGRARRAARRRPGRPGQPEVAIQEGRCQRCALRAHLRGRRTGDRRSDGQGAARRLGGAAAPHAGRRVRLGGRPQELIGSVTTMPGCPVRAQGFHGLASRPRRTGAA